ncbi:MAG: nucleotidyltransferase family protein [Planctomycetota bacterium]
MNPQIKIDATALANLCKRYHIAELKLYGSALGDAFRPDSDVDLLVTFKPGHTPGWEIVDIEQAFSSLFGRPVDLVTEASLRPNWRSEVLPSAEVLYAA